MRILQEEQQVALGALFLGKESAEFIVWAPLLRSVAIKITSPDARMIAMAPDGQGYWRTTVTGLSPGTRYVYRLNDEKDRPDPASRFQPEGVHGPSQLVDPAEFIWEDGAWEGIPLHDFIIYELHIGTFTPEGTFEAAVRRLDYLKHLGITVLEIMPVAQFPGARNWGYDGVYPYAPQNSYGGPAGLKKLINACHKKGLAVILDVVYNHLGPDGNYLSDFGPYFTGKYSTPWGDAINYDGPYSDDVRNYFISNAVYWITEYHMDGLRLDAIDTIFDHGAKHFLAELTETVHGRAKELGRKISVIAESDLNDVRIINPFATGGYNLDAQWNDDFHHSLHTLLTDERNGYYLDFGKLDYLEKAYREGFVYSGQYSRYRKRKHGNSSNNNPAHQFVVCAQNHDQIGNRMAGGRLSTIVSFNQLKLAAACVILSPFIPLLFMGEEYGETAPFQYFVSHIDEPLISAVRKGRAEEFAHFQWEGDVPDPQDEETFLRSKTNPDLMLSGEHKFLFDYYRNLLRLRKTMPALSHLAKDTMEVMRFDREGVLLLRRWNGKNEAVILFSFNENPVSLNVIVPPGNWTKMLDSSSPEWGGSGERAGQTLSSPSDVILHVNPHNVLLYEHDREDEK